MQLLGTTKPQTNKKFMLKHTNDLSANPTLIVGQNPGRQRLGEESHVVWEGNRSSDFLMECLFEVPNTILTNVCLYQRMTHENVLEGIQELTNLIQEFQPRKIICLGNFAYRTVISLVATDRIQDVDIVKLPHPSYIVRFNKDKQEYKLQIRKEVIL